MAERQRVDGVRSIAGRGGVNVRSNCGRTREGLVGIRIEETRDGYTHEVWAGWIRGLSPRLDTGNQRMPDRAGPEPGCQVCLILKEGFEAIYSDLVAIHSDVRQGRIRSNATRDLSFADLGITDVV